MCFSKRKLVFLLVFCVCIVINVSGQIQIESSYIFPSNFRDSSDNEIGGKGDFKDIRLEASIPFYVKLNDRYQPTLWAFDVKGLYASMHNVDLADDLCIDQLLNTELGITHLRPIHKKWSFMASLNGGVYTDLSYFSGNSILAEVATLFIWSIRPNLTLGFGVGAGNAIDYMVITPLLMFQWNFWKIETKIELLDGLLVSTGIKLNDMFTLRIVTQTRSMSAVVNVKNEPNLFTNSFTVTGIQPEIKINKNLSLSILAGISQNRQVHFKERNSVSFAFTGEAYSNFALTAYLSTGLKYSFGK